jgi:hypothetical protein
MYKSKNIAEGWKNQENGWIFAVLWLFLILLSLSGSPDQIYVQPAILTGGGSVAPLQLTTHFCQAAQPIL